MSDWITLAAGFAVCGGLFVAIAFALAGLDAPAATAAAAHYIPSATEETSR